MKQVYAFLIFVLVSIHLQAQQSYFITIDSDDNQFFSVTVGKKHYSSSAIGHLVIPNLKDSSYKLAISFPGSKYAEQSFTIDVNKKDRGYQLKKNAEKSWSLQELGAQVSTKTEAPSQVNVKPAQDTPVKPVQNTPVKPIQDAPVKPPQDTTVKRIQDVPVKPGNAFAKMMAAVVNDTAVLSISPLKSETVKKPEVTKKQPEAIKDTAKQVNLAATDKKADSSTLAVVPTAKLPVDSLTKTEKTNVAKSQTDNNAVKDADSNRDKNVAAKTAAGAVVIAKAEKRSSITKISERWTKESREFVFIDSSNGTVDTVRVLIAFEKAADEKIEAVDTAAVEGKTNRAGIDSPEMKIAVPVAPVVNKSPDPVVAGNGNKAIDTLAGKKAAPPVLPEKKMIINSDCKNFATEADVDKLRIKMFGESNLDERILIAKKVFRTKCFTTRQIKALTELFVNDKTRYAFFDAAYPFVSDTGNFRQLIELLSDVYYIDRFKVMVRMQ